MPNWCMTAYAIEGNKRTLKRIEKTINKALDGTLAKAVEKSDKTWQGNVLNALGVKFIKDGSWNVNIRGFFYDKPEMRDGALRFTCEEAWSRTEFAEMLCKKFPSLTVYWMEEEPGFDVYATNDANGKYFYDRFFVDTCIGGEYQSEYFETKEDAYKWISMISECENEEDVAAFNENRQQADSDDYIYVNEFDVC